jgi:putative OPT family oligopeptide transporter
MQWVGFLTVASVVPIYLVYHHVTGDTGVSAVMALVMLVAGFLFSAVASYMAGLVGSSNNPISGVTIATILTSALLLLGLGTGSASGPAAAILIGAVVCCAAAIGGDNLQDLKTGHLVGATPWKQQVMQAVGVVAAAFVIAPVLTLLLKAYGIGPVTVAGQKPLGAPQATLMASVARGVFARDLPWGLIGVGMALAGAVIVLDIILERRGSTFRTPVMAVAVGLYLPLELGMAILAGGLVAWTAAKLARGAQGQGGLLVAAGLITGEAIMGILLAIPIAANGGENPIPKALGIRGEAMTWPGVLVLHVAFLLLLRSSRRGEGGASA